MLTLALVAAAALTVALFFAARWFSASARALREVVQKDMEEGFERSFHRGGRPPIEPFSSSAAAERRARINAGLEAVYRSDRRGDVAVLLGFGAAGLCGVCVFLLWLKAPPPAAR
jgi:hypothetical protein